MACQTLIRFGWRKAATATCCLALLAATLAWAVRDAVQSAPATTRHLAEPITPVPASTSLDANRVALGERLFNDVRLSADNNKSCASCHALHYAAIDGRARGMARDGQARLRNTPTLFNVSLNASLNWDGAAQTLEAHAERLIANPDVMNASWPELLGKLKADPAYVSAFGAAYPQGITRANLLDAIAEFQRSLLTPNAQFDQYLHGDRAALSAEEKRGYELFKSYGCIACHQGVNIGGNLFQKFGVFQDPDAAGRPNDELDTGRYQITSVDRDRGVFRVPSLRNVALTAPYFHDGRMPSLEGAVDTMARVQLGRTLTSSEIDAIVGFLRTLTGEYRGQPLTLAAPPR